jgi:hypothetical protein
LEYRLKFRFYFEDYQPETASSPASHKEMSRLYWQTEAGASEYDVPQCREGTPPSQCIHEITSEWHVYDFVDGNEQSTAGIELIYAGPHCHAPTCLSMELYNADTGDLLCHSDAIKGSGSGLYDEHGYLSIPPCLWSENDDDGTPSPVFLPFNTRLLSIKRANSTYPHTGEMASWQMRGVIIPTQDNNSNESIEYATATSPRLRTTLSKGNDSDEDM